jgi:hypothetical protein
MTTEFVPNPNMVNDTAERMIERNGFDDAAWWANEHALDNRQNYNANGEAFWLAVRTTIYFKKKWANNKAS